jgi:hypothetical protein
MTTGEPSGNNIVTGNHGGRDTAPSPYPTGDLKMRVLWAIADSGAEGATDKELAEITKTSTSRVGVARKVVVADGWAVDAGLTRRLGRPGPPAIAWQVSADGAAWLGLDRGWTKKRRKKRRGPPKTETPEERRARQEREAIRAVDDLEPPGPRFRRHLGRLRDWSTWFSDLADLAEEEHCEDVEQQALLILLESVSSNLRHAQRALRKNRPKDMYFYELLGVPHDAEVEAIQRAYRDLARRHHPDVNSGLVSAKFVEITEAYNVLREPLRRHEYDSHGQR